MIKKYTNKFITTFSFPSRYPTKQHLRILFIIIELMPSQSQYYPFLYSHSFSTLASTSKNSLFSQEVYYHHHQSQ